MGRTESRCRTGPGTVILITGRWVGTAATGPSAVRTTEGQLIGIHAAAVRLHRAR
jgi:hypothetical protein